MPNKAELQKSAIDFAFETYKNKNIKEVMSQALQKFDALLYNDSDWEWWANVVNMQRSMFQGLETQKAGNSKESPPVEPPAAGGS